MRTSPKELRDFQYFYKLEDSRLFDKLLVSSYPEMSQIRNGIWETIACRFRKNRSQKKEILGTILCNLKEGLLNLQTIAVSRNRNDYYKAGRYHKLHLNYYDMIAVIDVLKEEGLIYSATGMNCRESSQRNKVSRIWASKALTQILLNDPRGAMKASILPEDDKLVVLKSRNNKRELDYEDTEFTQKLKSNLQEYHQFMEGVSIATHISATHPTIVKAIYLAKPFLPPPYSQIPKDATQYQSYVAELTQTLADIRPQTASVVKGNVTITINPIIYLLSHLLRRIAFSEVISPRLKAVFNKADFMRGGRLYSGKNGWQNLSQQDRKNITFDGKASVEADFKGMHINMLYALAGHPAPRDPYRMIPGTENDAMRTIVKKMLLVSINAKSDEQTIGVMQGYEEKLETQLQKNGYLNYDETRILNILSLWNQNIECWRELLEEIKTAHAPIQKFFCSDAGGGLMYKDSQIIMEAILSLIRQGIPCLPVHDSIIAPEEHKKLLCQAMDEAFFKLMGTHCPIEIK